MTLDPQSDPQGAEPRPPAAAGPADSRRILLASAAAAASSLLITLAAARYLDAELNRQFIVFWAILFGAFGVLSGIQHESTRAVASSQVPAPAAAAGSGEALRRRGRGRGTGLVTSALPLGLAAGGLIALSAPLWASEHFPAHPVAGVVLISLACIAYACHVALAGGSAGAGAWPLYARLMGAEALVRLALVLLVIVLSRGRPSLLMLEGAVAAAVLTWLVFALVSRSARRTAALEVDYSMRALTARRLSAMFTAACTAVLVTMYPAFIDAAAGDAPDTMVASTQIALQLTRAPIMIPLQALQGVAIAAFVAQQHRPLQALLSPLLRLAGLSVAGAIAAAVAGPWFLRLVDPTYVVSAPVFGGLVLAAGMVGILTLTGTAALAADRHVDYAAGWLLAGIVGIAGLWLPGALGQRVVTALLLGPAVGAALHLLLLHLRRAPQSPRRIPTP